MQGKEQIPLILLEAGDAKDNDKKAAALREELQKSGLFYVNLMSAPGSGKSAILLYLLSYLKKEGISCGVMEADRDAMHDAVKFDTAGFDVLRLNTGGKYHLDATMSKKAIDGFHGRHLDAVFLENVGNLMSPPSFDTGAALSIAVLSITDGDDMPLRYPKLFEMADIVIISKIDGLSSIDFDLGSAERNIKAQNENAEIYPVSAKTGEGMDALCKAIEERIKEHNGK